MPLFTVPIHEHGDPSRPGPYPHGGGGGGQARKTRKRSTRVAYTPEERHALKMYQGSADPDPADLYLSGGFNDLLRGRPHIDWLNGPPHEITPTPAQLAYYRQQIAHLKAAIERTPTTADQVLYRGVTAELVPLLQDGTVFTDLGFTSLSADKTVASERFTGFSRLDDLNPGNKGRVYEVHVPRGTPLLDVDRILNPDNDPDYTTEREHLLRPGTRFQVEGNILRVLR